MLSISPPVLAVAMLIPCLCMGAPHSKGKGDIAFETRVTLACSASAASGIPGPPYPPRDRRCAWTADCNGRGVCSDGGECVDCVIDADCDGGSGAGFCFLSRYKLITPQNFNPPCFHEVIFKDARTSLKLSPRLRESCLQENSTGPEIITCYGLREIG